MDDLVNEITNIQDAAAEMGRRLAEINEQEMKDLLGPRLYEAMTGLLQKQKRRHWRLKKGKRCTFVLEEDNAASD